MTFSKNKRSVYWVYGETISGIQIPKMWKWTSVNGTQRERVGRPHPAHFFGKGKPPQQCSGTDTCYYCKDGMVATWKFRTVAIVDGKPYFIDLDGSLSRTIAEMQILLRDQGATTEQIQKKVYSITRSKVPKTKPAYTVMIIGEKELPEILQIAMLPGNGISSEVITEQKDPGLPKMSSKSKKPEEPPKPVEDLPVLKPAVGLSTEELDYLAAYEPKIKKHMAADMNWDMVDALKTALKRQGWDGEKIGLALAKFDKTGTFSRG